MGEEEEEEEGKEVERGEQLLLQLFLINSRELIALTRWASVVNDRGDGTKPFRTVECEEFSPPCPTPFFDTRKLQSNASPLLCYANFPPIPHFAPNPCLSLPLFKFHRDRTVKVN